MKTIKFEVLNLILSNLDNKPKSIEPIKGYVNLFTVCFDNDEIAEVEIFPHNKGINYNWIKTND